jgi:hypothetical protein
LLSFLRAPNNIVSASIARSNVDLPGLTHALAQKLTACCSTDAGFGNVVAALSR